MPSQLLPRPARALAGLALAATVAFALTLLASPAGAQMISPSISPAGITVESPVVPGEETRLPSLGVRNEGDTALRFRMEARFDDPVSRGAVGWVRFEPETFELPAGEGREVRLRLDVPGDQDQAAFRLLLSASVLPEGDDEAVNVAVSAAVASVLEFEVGERPPSTGWFPRYGIPALLGLAVVGAGMAGYKVSEATQRLEFRSPIRLKRGGAPDAGEGSTADAEAKEETREQSS